MNADTATTESPQKKSGKHWNANKNKTPQKDWGKVAQKNAEPEPEEITTETKPGIEHPDRENLEEKLTTTEMDRDKLRDDKMRMQAEIANIMQRCERNIANAHKYALEKFAAELLPVIDNLERSCATQVPENNEIIKNIYTGIELTLKMFLETLQKSAITQINPLGEPFNPEFHTAMSMQEDPNNKPNTVLQVIQKGYLIKDRLLRPALVIVAK